MHDTNSQHARADQLLRPDDLEQPNSPASDDASERRTMSEAESRAWASPDTASDAQAQATVYNRAINEILTRYEAHWLEQRHWGMSSLLACCTVLGLECVGFMFFLLLAHRGLNFRPHTGAAMPKEEQPPETVHTPAPAADDTTTVHHKVDGNSVQEARVPTIEDLAGWASAQGLQLLPQVSDHVAVATHRGPRQSNQDCGLAFAVRSDEPWGVLVLADGCGGSSHAAEASRIAVRAAAESILHSINDDARLAWACHPQEVAIRSIIDAQAAVAAEAERQSLPRQALRTTLICVVQKDRMVGYAHIGDGGGALGAGMDDCQEFLVPQKAHGRNNVLRAALGPDMIGGPRAGSLEITSDRQMIIAGSDGVFDLYEPCDVLESVGRCIRDTDEDPHTVTTGFIHALAAQTDEKGELLASDNITLGVMMPTNRIPAEAIASQGASQ